MPCKTQIQTSKHAQSKVTCEPVCDLFIYLFFTVRAGVSVVPGVFHRQLPVKTGDKDNRGQEAERASRRQSAAAAATRRVPTLSSLGPLKPIACFLGEDVDSLCGRCQMAEPSHSI